MRTFRAPRTPKRKLTAEDEIRLRPFLIDELQKGGGYSPDYLNGQTTRFLFQLRNRLRPAPGLRALSGLQRERGTGRIGK